MMTHTLLSRCAPFAIGASAAFPAIPAFAQDATAADPIIVLPSDPVTAAPAPAPAIVLPDPIPVPEPAPAMATANAATVPAERTAPRAAARPARQAASRNRAPSVAAAVAPMAATRMRKSETAAPVAATVAPVPTEPRVAAAPEPAPRATFIDERALAGILGALGLAAVGGVALVASRRRRERQLDEPAFESAAFEPEFPEPVALATPEPIYAAPAVARPAASLARTPGSDPVALPAAIPETFEERDALLKSLVAAQPDRANPFTSPRARARRAKLIMQSLGRNFQNRKPRIDLSEYSHRWPALRGWQPATA